MLSIASPDSRTRIATRRSAYTYDQSPASAQSACYNIGHRTTMTDAGGTENLAYDKMGRELVEKRITNSVTENTTYTYDLAGRSGHAHLSHRPHHHIYLRFRWSAKRRGGHRQQHQLRRWHLRQRRSLAHNGHLLRSARCSFANQERYEPHLHVPFQRPSPTLLDVRHHRNGPRHQYAVHCNGSERPATFSTCSTISIRATTTAT